MTENMETTGTGTGAQAGQPAASPSPTGTSSAVSMDAVVGELQKLTSRLDQIERGAQSVKDKRIAGLQGDMDTFKSQLTELRDLMAGGLSESAALRLMSVQSSQPTQQPAPQVGPQGANANGINISQVVSAMKLDAADPAVIQALRTETNEVKLVATLAAIAEAKARPAPPTPAGQMMPTPSAPAGSETKETVLAELREAMKSPSQNIMKIRQLQAKLNSL